MSDSCPACLVLAHRHTPVQSLYVGLGIALRLKEEREILSRMCERHRNEFAEGLAGTSMPKPLIMLARG